MSTFRSTRSHALVRFAARRSGQSVRMRGSQQCLPLPPRPAHAPRSHPGTQKPHLQTPAPPPALSIDIIDASGTAESDVNFAAGARLHKLRLNAAGRPLRAGGEYHTPQSQQAVVEAGRGTVMTLDLGASIQQMGDMEEELSAHEGCRLRGDMTVRRVAGRVHFAVHQQSFMDLLPQVRVVGGGHGRGAPF
jgi:hypothetical protein